MAPPTLSAMLAASLLVAGAGGLAEEAAPGSGGALRISAEPPRLELGMDDGCELRVAAPPEVEEVSFTVSAGRVEDVRRLPGGGFAARFRAPAEKIPRVAIVAAIARGGRGVEDGWLAIPMAGRGTAKVHASPGTEVTLRVGDRTFGPTVANGSGVAAIPVVVPPGIREAHQGFRPLDLHVPETPLLHAAADRAEVRADREEKVRLFAYVVAPHGAARRGDVLTFEPSRGSVSMSAREPGAFVGTWTLPPGPAGEDHLSVRLPSAPASRAVVRITSIAGPPATVAVSFDRAVLVAGGDPAAVTVRALDSGGNLVPAVLVLSVAGAELSGVTEKRAGEIVAKVAPGERLRGEEAVVSASVPAVGISGSRSLALRPGAPAAAHFERRAAIRAAGAPVGLRLAIADAYGNPVGTSPEVSAERGRIVAVAEGGPGDFEVRYLPPRVERPARESLVARSGSATTTFSPVVLPRAPALRLEAAAGGALDVRGRFSAGAVTLAAERPADLEGALRLGLETGLRLEAGVLSGRGTTLGTALLGGSLRSTGFERVVVGATAAVGAAMGDGGLYPAGRAAASLALPLSRTEPYLELSFLGARSAALGAFGVLALSAGIRFGVEGRHDKDPDRR